VSAGRPHGMTSEIVDSMFSQEEAAHAVQLAEGLARSRHLTGKAH
jgi:hypothetical protein